MRCGFQHNNTHLNDIQHKNTQLDVLKCNTEYKWTKHYSLLNAAFFNVILCVVLLITVSKLDEKICIFYRGRAFQHNDFQHNDIQLKNTQLNSLKCDTEHKWTKHNSLLNVAFFNVMLCRFADNHILIVMLCVAMLNVVMLSVAAPF
jgi:hypothetical protein